MTSTAVAALHSTMRHHGATGSGLVNDSCKNYYHPTHPQLSSTTRRLSAPKLILAGACVVLVGFVLVLIARLITKQHDEQIAHKADSGQVPVQWMKNEMTKNFFSPPSDTHSHTTEIYKVKTIKDNKLSAVCKIWPHSNYTFKDHEKIYFQYWKEDGSKRRETTVTDDSEIMQRLRFQRKLEMKDISTKFQRKTILTLSLLDNDQNDLRRCSKSNTEKSYCNFIIDKSKIESADAVIFREQDLNYLPKVNRSKQIWIYNTLTPNDINMSVFVEKIEFNLTGTYDFRSHIPMLPMYWNETYKAKDNREFTRKNYTDETVRLVVYNNDCEDENKFYEKYKDVIEGLEGDKGEIIVEWFSSHNCSKSIFNITRKSDCFNLSSAECYKRLKSEKKFALAFEVSNADYISERFFDPLSNSIIPVAIGSTLSKYSAVSPRDSFIYFCDYDVDELRKLLKLLNSNEEKLEKYFSWKKKGQFLPASMWYCQVCFMLHRASQQADDGL